MDEIIKVQEEKNRTHALLVEEIVKKYKENPIELPQITQAMRNNQRRLMLFNSESWFIEWFIGPCRTVNQVGTYKYLFGHITTIKANSEACERVVNEFKMYCAKNNIDEHVSVINSCGYIAQAEIKIPE